MIPHHAMKEQELRFVMNFQDAELKMVEEVPNIFAMQRKVYI